MYLFNGFLCSILWRFCFFLYFAKHFGSPGQSLHLASNKWDYFMMGIEFLLMTKFI